MVGHYRLEINDILIGGDLRYLDTCFIGTKLFRAKKSLLKIDSNYPPKTPEAHRQSAINARSTKNYPLDWRALPPIESLISICLSNANQNQAMQSWRGNIRKHDCIGQFFYFHVLLPQSKIHASIREQNLHGRRPHQPKSGSYSSHRAIVTPPSHSPVILLPLHQSPTIRSAPTALFCNNSSLSTPKRLCRHRWFVPQNERVRASDRIITPRGAPLRL